MRDDGTDFLLFRKYRSDISGITTKAPCEAALMGERHVRIEISDFVMRTFVLMHGNIACDISGITTKAPCRRDIVHLRVSDAHCV